MHGRARILAVGLVTFLVTLFGAALAEDDTYKADFIVKLFDYVQWPAGFGPDSNGSATIGVVGESPMVAALTTAAKNAGSRKIAVKVVSPTDPLTDCAILYLPTTDKTELAKVLKKLGTAPIVTVSDCSGFAGFGVMVNFYKEDETGKTRFEINNLAAGDAKLKISSQLLKLARII
ncbi:hypothetical protein C3F09_05830 [candidate division GN15 bacterium]|uniref:YfiR family protein n=1 Tax=candidate division GN15 bacterium TaxID=2072418 RepID=A0A855X6N6_9BACT|nr:MAG: hypothetical protein C3F09_05830 [candidate division GN15 bacterium]